MSSYLQRRQRILDELAEIIEFLTGFSAAKIDTQATFLELGVDSLLMIQASESIHQRFGLAVPFRALFEDLVCLDALADHLDRELPDDAPVLTAPPPSSDPPAETPVEPQASPAAGIHPPAQSGPTPVTRAVTSATALSLPPVQPLAPAASAPGTAASVDASVENIIRQQIRIMQQQLEVLGHPGAVPLPAALAVPAATAASPTAAEAVPATSGQAAPAAPIQPVAGKAGEATSAAKSAGGKPVTLPFQLGNNARQDQLTPRQSDHLEGLIARLGSRTQESKRRVQAGRRQLADNRSSVRFRAVWKEITYPILAERSRGSRVWDVDGNEYVDVTMGFGVNLFGHMPAFLREAIDAQLDRGMHLGPQSDLADEVASLICELTGVERAAFSNSGTEAVMVAIRLARAVTGRQKIAMFAGSYHGWSDATLGRPLADGRVAPLAPGVPRAPLGDLLVLDYDSEESLDLIQRHAGELAAVLVEPVQSRRPGLQPREFLHSLRQLTHEHGIALIFDEMITGFRSHPGGAQTIFDIQADIVTYGKALAGGLPIGVIAGNHHYLDAIDGGYWQFGDDSRPEAGKTLFAGTFCKHPLAMAGARASLSHLKAEGPALQERLNHRTAELTARLDRSFERLGAPLRMDRFASLFLTVPTAPWRDADLLPFHLLEHGVYAWEGATRFLSTAHTDEDVDQIVHAVEASVEALIDGDFLGSTHESQDASESSSRRIPTNEGQRNFYALGQLGLDAASACNEAFCYDFPSGLNRRAMAAALHALCERHEAFQLRYAEQGEALITGSEIQLTVPFIDLSALPSATAERVGEELSLAAAWQPIDPHQAPLFLCHLFIFPGGRVRLMLTVHHAIIDSRAGGVMMQELSSLYIALRRGQELELPPPRPFDALDPTAKAPARRQREEVNENYWLERFADGLPMLDLPTDRPRPPMQSFRAERWVAHLDADMTHRLRDLSGRTGNTVFVTLLSGFALLLHRICAVDRLVVGVNAIRPDLEETPHIGFNVHPVLILSQADHKTSVSDYLKSLRQGMLEAYEHQEVSLRRLLQRLGVRRDPSRPPLTATAFNLDKTSGSARFGGHDAIAGSFPCGVRSDLLVNAVERPGDIDLLCDFPTALFDRSTIAGWFDQLTDLLHDFTDDPEAPIGRFLGPLPASAAAEITSERPSDEIPLTRYQQLFWMGQRLDGDQAPSILHIGLLVEAPDLDREHFAAAWRKLVERSDALRLRIVDEGGLLRQVVRERVDSGYLEADLSAETDPWAAAQSWADARFQRPLHLEEQLFESAFLDLGKKRSAWYLSLSHLIADGWGMERVFQYTADFYELALAGKLDEAPELPDFASHARAEETYLSSAEARPSEAFWEERLADMPGPTPFFGQVTSLQTFRVQKVSRALGLERSQRLVELVSQAPYATGSMPVSMANGFSALILALMFRLSGKRDLSLGFPFHNRTVGQDKATIGPFMRIVPLFVHIDPQNDFADLIAQLAAEYREVKPHLAFPIGNRTDRPAYDVEANSYNARFARFGDQPAKMVLLHPGFGREHLAVHARDFLDEGDLVIDFHFHLDVFDEAAQERTIDTFLRLVDAWLEDPKLAVGDIPLVDPEPEHFTAVGAALDVPDGKTFLDLFAASAKKQAKKIAAICDGKTLTYAELHARSQSVARRLAGRGFGPEGVVAVYGARGLDYLTALLGVLESGAAYLPLDPASPPERLAGVVADSGAGAILAIGDSEPAEAIATAMGPAAPPVLDLTAEVAAGLKSSGVADPLPATPSNLAYVIYTSGSTGVPKGAMVHHHGMLNHMLAKVEDLDLSAKDVVVQNASQSFDISVWQFLVPLAVGARVVVVGDEDARDPARLLHLVSQHEVTVLETVPVLLRELVAQLETSSDAPSSDTSDRSKQSSSLRWMLSTGEALAVDLWQEWLRVCPEVRLLNAYGPTECSDDVTHAFLDHPPADGCRVTPIGQTIANTRLYIVDQALRPLPSGLAGELAVGGLGVGRGYLNDPRRTATIFLPDPWAGPPGARLYATGDLVRRGADSIFEMLARIDHQVKVRGYRIELGEIEAALRRHPQIHEAVAGVRSLSGDTEEDGHDRALVAWVVAGSDAQPPTSGELRDFLRRSLPAYMVPAAFVILDELPLNRSGKVDRKALPRPSEEDLRGTLELVEPRNEQEQKLLEIWCQVLGRKDIGVEDDFFEIGGDSILALMIVSKANQAGFRLSPADVFMHPTVAELADTDNLGEEIRAEQGPISGQVPLTPVQNWFFELDLADRNHFNQAVLLKPREPLAPAGFHAALNAVLGHHDTLRARFEQGGGSWSQVFEPAIAAVPYLCLDLSALQREEGIQCFRELTARAQATLHLNRGSVFRAVHFRLSGEERLLLIAHHLVVDGVSWRVLLEDLESAYRQSMAGDRVALPPKTSSFLDWSQGLRERVDSELVQNEGAEWVRQPWQEVPSLPVDLEAGDIVGSGETFIAKLDRDATQVLVQELPKRLEARIDAVLLTALGSALREWTGSGWHLVELEGHGRDDLGARLDLSRTVGWFTAMYPFLYGLKNGGSLDEAVAEVDRRLEELPSGGLAFTLLRYLSDTPLARRIRELPQPQIGFNYLGQFDQTLAEKGLFEAALEGTGPTSSRLRQRSHLLDINIMIIDGTLKTSWSYSRQRYQPNTIENLAENFLAALRRLIAPEEPKIDVAEPAVPEADPFADFGWDAEDMAELQSALHTPAEGEPRAVED